jgi:hypothetical protein
MKEIKRGRRGDHREEIILSIVLNNVRIDQCQYTVKKG